MKQLFILDQQNTQIVTQYLSGIIGDSYESFCSLLQETGSVIGGDYITQCLLRYRFMPKIEIYCTFDGARHMNYFLQDKQIVEINNQNISVVLCTDTFLRQTKVQLQITYKHQKYNEMVLKIFKNKEDIINAVINSDFSFTQVMFDGVHVKATYPDDISSKIGHLKEDYVDLFLNGNSNLIERISFYRDKGFSISIQTTAKITIVSKPTFLKSLMGISEEEFVVNYLYNQCIESMITSNPLSEFSQTSMFFTYFKLVYSIDEFFELVKALAFKKCILPFWIKDEYETKFSSDIIKAMVLVECELFMLLTQDSEGTYQEYAKSVVEQKIPLDKEKIEYQKEIESSTYNYNDFLEWVFKKYNKKHYVYYIKYHPLIKKLKNEIYWKEKNICILKDEEERFQIEQTINRKNKRDRTIPWLNMVDLIETKPLPLDPNVDTKCMEIHEEAQYDINAYLRGEAVQGYNNNGERDESLDIPAVSESEARERLVFFAKASSDSNEFKPFCYNLRGLAKDVSHQLFLECEGPTMKNIQNHLDNPVLKLNLGWPVYVPLGELLHAIYKTDKQVFLLFPKLEVVVQDGELIQKEQRFEYTASLSTLYGNDYVSSTHCGDNTDKPIYTIRPCEGTTDNSCWPITEGFFINEYKPDKYFLQQRYYLVDKQIDRLTREQFILESKKAQMEISLAEKKSQPKDYIYSYQDFTITIKKELKDDFGLKRLVCNAILSYTGDDSTFIEYIKKFNREHHSRVKIKELAFVGLVFYDKNTQDYSFIYDEQTEPPQTITYTQGFKGAIDRFYFKYKYLDTNQFPFLLRIKDIEYRMLLCCICEGLKSELVTHSSNIIVEEQMRQIDTQEITSIYVEMVKNFEKIGMSLMFPEIYDYTLERLDKNGISFPMVGNIGTISDYLFDLHFSPEILMLLPNRLCDASTDSPMRTPTRVLSYTESDVEIV